MSQYDYHTRNHPGLNKTPPDLRPNDLRHISLWKQDGDDTPIGLIVEKKAGTKEYYVKEITEGGLLQQRHGNSISVGDRIVKLNDKPIEEEFTSVWDVNNHIKKQTKLKLHIYRTGFHLAQEQNPWGKADYSVGNAPSKSTSNNSAAAPAIPPAPKKYSPPKKAEQAASATETQSTTPTNDYTPKQPETKQDQKQPAEGTTGGNGDNSSCCVLL